MWTTHHIVRRAAAGGALVLAVALPNGALAASCPSVAVECGVDIVGKRYLNGQETAVRCRASAGHSALYRPGESAPTLLVSISADDPACAGVRADMLPAPDPELVVPRVERPAALAFTGGSEQRLDKRGEAKGQCVLAMTNVDLVGDEGVGLEGHGHLGGFGKLAEVAPGVDGIGSAKADVVYRRRQTVDTPVAFVGSITLRDCVESVEE